VSRMQGVNGPILMPEQEARETEYLIEQSRLALEVQRAAIPGPHQDCVLCVRIEAYKSKSWWMTRADAIKLAESLPDRSVNPEELRTPCQTGYVWTVVVAVEFGYTRLLQHRFVDENQGGKP
jgi:hypothetical protein